MLVRKFVYGNESTASTVQWFHLSANTQWLAETPFTPKLYIARIPSDISQSGATLHDNQGFTNNKVDR